MFLLFLSICTESMKFRRERTRACEKILNIRKVIMETQNVVRGQSLHESEEKYASVNDRAMGKQL